MENNNDNNSGSGLNNGYPNPASQDYGYQDPSGYFTDANYQGNGTVNQNQTVNLSKPEERSSLPQNEQRPNQPYNQNYGNEQPPNYNYNNNGNQQQPYYAGRNGSQQNNAANGLAIASMIMGIISILSSCCYGAGIIFGILGIIFGAVSKKSQEKLESMAVAGIVCSIIGIAFSILYWVLVIFGVTAGIYERYDGIYF